MSFDDLGLGPKILKAIAKAQYTTPSEIQQKAIPLVMEGSDLRASAETGTGKTAAFLLPALHRLTSPSTVKGKGPRVLILVPTRELAQQIATQSEKYSRCLERIKTVCVVGGVPYHKQTGKLSRPYDILIATPGRLIDFINQKKVDFSRLEMLVLDEADRMLDMGFIGPIKEIAAATPSERQTLLFSATLPKEVIKLSESLLNKPKEIVMEPKKKKVKIKQSLHFADDLRHKNRILDHILQQEGVDSSIIFTSTKRHAEELTFALKDREYEAAAFHGDMNQRQRTRTIKALRSGKVRILVATDIAARGIDVDSISHVINFDLPHHVEDYVHRIGRTGRAGRSGTAHSLVSGRDAKIIKEIQAFTGQPIDVIEFEGLEPRPEKKRPSKPRQSRKGPFHRNKNKRARKPRR